MKKEFVPYELAVKLKALGFDEPCFKYIYIGDTGVNVNHDLEVEPSKAKNFNADDLCISIPTYSQAFRWFREKHGMVFNLVGSGPYYPSIAFILIDGNSDIELGEYDNYEEAELACLTKLIEIVETKSE